MTRIPKPFNPATGGSQRIEEVIADIDAIRDIANGSLEIGVNVRGGSPSPLDGVASDGVGLGAMRSDAKPLVRAFEILSAQPASGHFLGRGYFDTTKKQELVCVDAGTPTYQPKNGLTAADMPVGLGARLADGGADPIPDLGLTSPMLSRAPSITNQTGDVSNLGTGWTTILTMPRINDLPGTQAIIIEGMLMIQNFSGTDANIAWRVTDSDASDAFVCGGRGIYCQAAKTTGIHLFALTTLGVGDHTMRLQAERIGGAAGVTVLAQDTLDSQQMKSHLAVLVG